MKDNGADHTVIDRLLGALDSNALPSAAQDHAKHLLNRLSQPVRVSVLGMPKSGKSELVNMFVGDRLVPKDAQLPTTEFTWGDTEAMIVTSADGTTEHFDRVDLEVVSGTNAAFLRVELPVPILQQIRLLEVVTEGSAQELASAIDWAVRRTDIALWCSQDFDKIEQTVWSCVPDSLKDHAFLALTKADVLSAQKQLSARVASLETIVSEEFHSLFAVATLQAVRAQAGKDVDQAMLQASGGGALMSEVLRHADHGRRADFDSAHMFLARYKIKDAPKPAASKEITQPESKPASAPAKAVEPAKSAPASAPIKNTKLFAESVHFLKRRGEGLAQTVSELGAGNVNAVVLQCVNAVEHLVDTFSQDESGCEAADAFIDDLSEAADMMVLMQAEAGDAPAADAVTLLLQLRRDMEMQLAA